MSIMNKKEDVIYKYREFVSEILQQLVVDEKVRFFVNFVYDFNLEYFFYFDVLLDEGGVFELLDVVLELY